MIAPNYIPNDSCPHCGREAAKMDLSAATMHTLDNYVTWCISGHVVCVKPGHQPQLVYHFGDDSK